MAKQPIPNRIPTKKVTRDLPLILDSNSRDLLWLRADEVIVKDSSGYAYNRYIGGPAGRTGDGGPGDGNDGGDDGLPEVDTVDMTDIESLTFEEYVDPSTKITKYNCMIKIRNSSKSAASVVGVDARVYDSASASYVAVNNTTTSTPTNNSPEFVTPTPSVPSVIFDRTGTTGVSWGWNDVSGFGSYSNIEYEWIISTSSSGGTIISQGTKSYPSASYYGIGDSGKTRQYKISSSQGDTPPSSSARWLKVRAVVTGTNNKKYYSSYSTPI